MMQKEWSLKGRWGLLDNGRKIYTEEDIKTLKHKLIGDLKKKVRKDIHPLKLKFYSSEYFKEIDDEIENIISKRFGNEIE